MIKKTLLVMYIFFTSEHVHSCVVCTFACFVRRSCMTSNYLPVVTSLIQFVWGRQHLHLVVLPWQPK